MDEQKVNRRKFLNIAATAVVVGVVAGVGGYYAGSMSAPVVTTTKTQATTVTTTATTTLQPTTTTTKPASGTPIKFANIAGITGAMAESVKPSMNTMALYAEMQNAKGGILGRPVEIVNYDDKSDEATAVAMAERALTVDNIPYFISYGSGMAFMAVTNLIEKYKAVGIQANPSNICFSRGLNRIFCSQRTLALDMGSNFFDWVKNQPAATKPKTVALLYEDTSTQIEAVHDAFEKYNTAEVGLTATITDKVAPNSVDISSLISKAKASKPDVLYGGFTLSNGILLMRTMNEQHWRPKMIYLHIVTNYPEFYALGDIAQGVCDATVWSAKWTTAQGFTGNEEFVAAYTKRFGAAPYFHLANPWCAMQMFDAAMTKTNSTDPDKLVQFLHSGTPINTIMLDGVVFDARGVPLYPMTHPKYPGAVPMAAMTQIQGGTNKVIVWPPEMKEGELKYPIPGYIAQ